MISKDKEVELFNKQYQTMLKRKRYKDIESLLKGMQEKNPNDWWLLAQTASNYLNLNKENEALKYSKKALKLAPSNPLVLDIHAAVLSQNGNYKMAIHYLEKIISSGIKGLIKNPFSEGKRWAESWYIDTFFSLAINYMYLENSEKSVELIRNHIKLRKKGVYSRYYKNKVFKTLREEEIRLQFYKDISFFLNRTRAKIITPANTNIDKKKKQLITKKYYAFINNNQFSQAAKFLFSELKKDPHDYWLLTHLSEVHISLKKNKEALKYAEKAFNIEPIDPMVIEEYADALRENKRFHESTKLLELLISWGLEKLWENPYSEGKRWMESLFVDAHYSLSLNYYDLQDLDKSKKFIKLFIEKRRKGVYSRYNLRYAKIWLNKLVSLNN